MKKKTITNAADITVLPLQANATLKTGGGPVSVGAVALMASQGPVMQVTQVTADNWQDIFGKPLPKKSVGMEGLRHLADAVRDCDYVNVVRVVASDAAFPTLALVLADGTIATGALAYGTAVANGAGHVFTAWPIDGNPSTNRSFEIANVINDLGAYDTDAVYAVNDVVSVTGGKLICVAPHIATDTDPTLAAPTVRWKVYDGQYDNRATLNFYDKDDEGVEYLLETYLVGFDPSDVDDLGRSAFIETVLEQQSDRFRCDYDEELSFATILTALQTASGTKTAFTGGSNGGTPVSADWVAAWDIFRNQDFAADLMFAAGNYDATVLANCIDIADDRHVSFFFDVQPALPPDQALTWLKGTGLQGRQAAVYYNPYSATDAYYGGSTIWGVSGEAAAACAKGAQNFTGATPGVHYAPAGTERARLSRTGIKALHPNDVINRDDFYTARINPVISGQFGGAVIDDCLALWYKQDYRRFIWVNRIANYIDHRFVEGAAALKFEPDGLTRTGLANVMTQILDEMVNSGALVPPRDPADGTAPYTFTITQQEIDLWLVDWAICPTGAARRIAGQPRLIK